MVHEQNPENQTERIDDSIKLTRLELIFMPIFLVIFYNEPSSTVYEFTSSNLSSALFTLYGIFIGSIFVVYALVAPKTESPMNSIKLSQLRRLLDKLLNTAIIIFALIFINIVFFLPVHNYLYLEIFALVEIEGILYITISMHEIILRLKQIFYLS